MAGLGKTYRVQGLFGGAGRGVVALEDVRLQAERGRTLAIVGESGCGKSSLARILAGLQPASTGGAALEGVDIAAIPVERRQPALRRRLQMVFQNPDATLNPSHSVGTALSRTVRRLRGVSRAEARRRSRRLARGGRAAGRVRPPHAAPALRRPEAARGDRPGAGGRPRPAARRRAGLRAGRLSAGRGGQPAVALAGDQRHHLAVHLARPGDGAAPRGQRGGHVSRPGRGDWPGRARLRPAVSTPTPKPCCRRRPIRIRTRPAGGSCCRAALPAPAPARAAACSARAARVTSAPSATTCRRRSKCSTAS